MHHGLPARSGLGLKSQHLREVLTSLPPIGFFEVHAENYMVPGGAFHHFLERIRAHYPLSMHGVGLSIGSESGLDPDHLDRLAALIERYEPASFSEHLAWSSHGTTFLNDLLPLPYDALTLARVCDHVDQVQQRLNRRMLLENPSTYVEFVTSTLSEQQFLSEVVRRTGCGLLLDVNNVHVSCSNHGRDAAQFLAELPLEAVGEIHLAGFARHIEAAGDALLIDSHSAPVDAAVWALYDSVLARIGAAPTLIEWDNDVPALAALLHEASLADQCLLALPPGGAAVRRCEVDA
ncbi:MAG: DUF692 domain-containing protein [Variovorax sp.]